MAHEKNMHYAGFWKRFAAGFIDYLITAVLGGMAGAILVLIYGALEGAEGIILAAGLLASWIYFAAFESSSRQASLGKMALGIKVTDLNGRRVGFGRATGRHFGKFISIFILYIGLIMIAFTQKKQGLHDMMAGCLVVNKQSPE